MRITVWNVRQFAPNKLTEDNEEPDYMGIYISRSFFRKAIQTVIDYSDMVVFLEVTADGVGVLLETVARNSLFSVFAFNDFACLTSPKARPGASTERMCICYNRNYLTPIAVNGLALPNNTVINLPATGAFPPECGASPLFVNSVFGTGVNPYVWAFRTTTNPVQEFLLGAYHAPTTSNNPVGAMHTLRMLPIFNIPDVSTIIVGDFNLSQAQLPNVLADFQAQYVVNYGAVNYQTTPYTVFDVGPTSLRIPQPTWRAWDRAMYCANPYDNIFYKNILPGEMPPFQPNAQPYMINLIQGFQNPDSPYVMDTPEAAYWRRSCGVPNPEYPLYYLSDAQWAAAEISDHLPVTMNFLPRFE